MWQENSLIEQRKIDFEQLYFKKKLQKFAHIDMSLLSPRIVLQVAGVVNSSEQYSILFGVYFLLARECAM
jgi:membrane protein CcdC involved in cytochrome C biogenesis